MGRVIVILKSTGGTLLASLRPLLVCVCSNPVKYSDPNLRASASLALAKFMLVRYVNRLTGPRSLRRSFRFSGRKLSRALCSRGVLRISYSWDCLSLCTLSLKAITRGISCDCYSWRRATLKHCISVTSCSNNDKAISLAVYTVKTFWRSDLKWWSVTFNKRTIMPHIWSICVVFCFSSEFCEEHLQLLFTILEKVT